MGPTDRDILEALKGVAYPGFTRDIVSIGAVTELRVENGRVSLSIRLAREDSTVRSRIEAEARAAIERLEGIEDVQIRSASPAGGSAALPVVGAKPPAAAGRSAARALLPDVRHTVAVASGKGGVGKSTVAVNLAVALARRGLAVGLLDADIYGPSIPLMMGLQGTRAERFVPFEGFGVRFMSVGFLVDPRSPVIWRGPLVMKAVEQLLGDVEWGALDVLVVDLPPGTGDVQLTLAQRVSLAGVVIVTTPQDVALADAVKGVAMFRKVGVPVLGLVENMSYHVCAGCGLRSEIFAHGGGRSEAKRMGVPFLGEVPLDGAIRQAGDDGRPIVDADPDGPQGAAFLELADRVREALDADGAAGAPQEKGGIFERFRHVWGRSEPS